MLRNEDKELIEKNINDIENIIGVLWNVKFRNIFSKLKVDYDDYAQEAFLAVCTNIGKYNKDKEASIKTFCSLVVRNKMMSYATYLNRKKRFIDTYSESIYQKINDESQTELIDMIADDNSNIKYSESELVVQAILKNIKFRKERVILQRLMEGFSVEDIAVELKICGKTAKSIIRDIKGRAETARVISREIKR